ncbi:class I SAM-dependent methyltransferase [Pseudorhodoplanes sinuspersici]|uniref:class I SAM-dependent methyltransferase n=1 Tax=Pseudorhodoplanes sinuspersici TaxID=1235591 RepID=UPI001FD8DED2|nr:class I SAM-dependent methyltransferase [Pseudorhodoplanes sinuspersici]
MITKANDRSVLSQELTAGIRDWASLYHLSPKRANLLRPFAALLGGRVLEVGAGCGALTRFLGENGGDVVALEGSLRRAHIARERTADQKNVRVVCEQLDAFAYPTPFDAVLSIGVLEYAAIYGNGHARPHTHFLKTLRQHLSSNGVVIIAIENKLGLKYFAGAREDHVGAEFYGINDGYEPGSVATFGRAELADLLTEAGLPAQAFFYPCPDYKLPLTLLSDPLLERHPDLASTLFAQSAFFDPQKPSDPTFSLEQGWVNLGRNRLIGELANSFLVVAGCTEEAVAPYVSAKDVAWHYSVDRHPAFAREVKFQNTGKGLVTKRSALSDIETPDVPVECVLTDEPFIAGDNWWNVLVSIINKPGWSIQQLAEWARPWLDAVTLKCGLEAIETSAFTKPVDGAHFDAMPFNMIRNADGTVHFFDQEWRLKPQLEFGYIIYRGLRDSLIRVSSCAASAVGTTARINDIVINILAQNGAILSRADVNRYAAMEGQIQSWIQGRITSNMSLADAERAWTTAITERLTIQRGVLAQEVQTLRAGLEDVGTKLRASNEELAGTQRMLIEGQERIQSLAGELAAAKEQLVRVSNMSATLRQEMARSEERRNALAQEARTLQDQLAQVHNAHSRDIQAARSQASELSATLAMQAREIDKLARSQFRWPFSGIVERIGRAFTPWKRTRFRERSWEAGLIKASRLFRPTWYLEQNPDVAKAGIDPLLHYILHGGVEGRAPHPLFDPQFYKAQIPEAERAALTPLAHYISAGVALGLDPHPLFDTKFYLRTNPDVAAASMNPLFHYMEYGWRERRDPNPLFSTSFYLEKNPAIVAVGINPLVHYLTASTSALVAAR